MISEMYIQVYADCELCGHNFVDLQYDLPVENEESTAENNP